MSGTDKIKTGRIGNRPYWVFSLSIIIRAGHQVGAAVFLTTYLLSGYGPPSTLFLYLVIGSGLALILTEWMRHRELYREFAGLAIILKILLVGAAFHHLLPAREAVLAGFVIASIGSHAPKILRHRLLF